MVDKNNKMNEKAEELENAYEEEETAEAGMEEHAAGGNENELKDQLTALNDKYLRLSAEFDNYRKRTLKEKAEILKNAGEDIFLKILPVMDNFERALDSMEKSDDIEAIRSGIRIIYNGFKDFLTQNGVQEMACLNREFNADEHEAITKIPAPNEGLKGKIVDCVQKGYTLNGKVVRFPKVVVGE